MPKKPKYRPEIARIKLNPEQAVLTCVCFRTRGGKTGYWGENDRSPNHDSWIGCAFYSGKIGEQFSVCQQSGGGVEQGKVWENSVDAS